MTPTPPLNPALALLDTTAADKAAQVAAAGLAKRASFNKVSPQAQLLSEYNADRLRLSNAELRAQYGDTLADASLQQDLETQRQHNNILRGRTAGELTKDTGLSLLSGGVNLVGGIPVAALDLATQDPAGLDAMTGGVKADIRQHVVAPAQRLLGQFNNWRGTAASSVKQDDQALMGSENAAHDAVTQAAYEQAVATGDNKLLAGGERLAKDFGHSFVNTFNHPTSLYDTAVEQVPTLALGAVAKGTVATKAAVERAAAMALERGVASEAGYNALLAEARQSLAKKPLYAMTAASEAGSNYGQAAGEIQTMPWDQLVQQYPDAQLRKDAGETEDSIRLRLASKVGLTTAAITAPIALASAPLAGNFELNPLGKNLGKGANKLLHELSDVGGEVLEETLQGGGGQLAQNLAEHQAGNVQATDPLSGVGDAAGQGAAAALGSSGALRAPGAHVDLAVGTAKTLGKVALAAGRMAVERGQAIAEANTAPAQAQAAQAAADLHTAARTVDEAVRTHAPDAPVQAPVASDPLLDPATAAIVQPDAVPTSKLEAMAHALVALKQADADPSSMPDEQKSLLNLFVAKTARELNQTLDQLPPEAQTVAKRLVNNDKAVELRAQLADTPDSEVQTWLQQTLDAAGEPTPASAQAMERIKEFAFIKPEALNAQQNGEVLAHLPPDTPEPVRKQFELNQQIAQLREDHAARMAQIQTSYPHFKTSDEVTDNVINTGFQTEKGRQLSMNEHVRNVVQAMGAGRVQIAASALADFGRFAAGMQAKAAAFDATAKQQLEDGRPDKPYTVAGSKTLAGTEALGTAEFKLNLHNKKAPGTIAAIFADANTLADSYNALLKAYPQLAGIAVNNTKPSEIAPAGQPTWESHVPSAPKERTDAAAAVVPSGSAAAEPAPAEAPKPVGRFPLLDTHLASAADALQYALNPPSDFTADGALSRASAMDKLATAARKKLKELDTSHPQYDGFDNLVSDASTAASALREVAAKQQEAEAHAPEQMAVEEPAPTPSEPPAFGMAEGAYRGKQAYVHDGVRVHYDVDAEGVQLNLLRNDAKDQRQSGKARATMERFLAAADAAGKPVRLSAAPQDATTEPARLKAFYASLGFQATEGDKMVRPVPGTETAAAEEAPLVPGLVAELGPDVPAPLRTNKFLASFKPAPGKTSLFQRVDNVREALRTAFRTKDLASLYPEDQRFLTPSPSQREAMGKLLLQVAPIIANRLNQNLQRAAEARDIATGEKKTYRGGEAKGFLHKLLAGQPEWQYDNQASLYFAQWGEENGQPFIRYAPQVAEAVSLAAVHWLMELQNRPTKPLDEEAEARLFPDSAVPDALRAAFAEAHLMDAPARELANQIQSMLGVRPDKAASQSYTDPLMQTLALDAIMALDSLQMLSIDAVKTGTVNARGRENTMSFLRMDTGAVQALRDQLEAPSLLTRMFFPDSAELPVLGTPRNGQDQVTAGTRQTLSTAQRDAVRHEGKVPFKLNLPYISTLMALGKTNALTLLGYETRDLAKFHPLDRLAVAGKNRALEAAFQSMVEAALQVHAYAAANGQEPGDVPVYFPHRMISNFRLMMNPTFNPQGNKTARETLVATTKTLDLLHNAEHQQGFFQALAQALGLKTEQLLPEEAVRQVQELLASPAYAEVLSGLQALQASADPTSEEHQAAAARWTAQVKALFGGKPATDKALHALDTYARYLATPQAERAQFRSAITLEHDGKTEGPFTALWHLGLHALDGAMLKQLRQSGLLLNLPETSLNEMGKGFGDIYRNVGERAQRELQAMLRQDGKNRSRLEASLRLLQAINYVTFPNGDLNQVEVTRDPAKTALTPMIYGSAASSVLTSMAKAVRDHFYQAVSQASLAERPLDPQLVQDMQRMIGRTLDLTDPHKVRLSAMDLDTLRTNLKFAAGGVLTEAVSTEIEPVLSTFQLMYDASALQATQYRELFNAGREARRQELIAAGTLQPHEALSLAEEQALLAQYKDKAPVYQLLHSAGEDKSHGIDLTTRERGGTFSVNGKAQQVRSIANGDLHLDVEQTELTRPGVRIAALLVQGLGDATLMTGLAQRGYLDTLKVFDGWETAPDKLAEYARAANTEVTRALQYNGLQAVVDSFASFDLDPATLSEAARDALGEELRIPGWDDMSRADKLTALRTVAEQTRSQLTERAAQIQALREVILSGEYGRVANDHMASAKAPAIIDGPVTGGTPEGDTAYLEAVHAAAAAKRAPVTEPASDVVETAVPTLAMRGKAQVAQWLSQYSFASKAHAFLAKQLVHLLPENLVIYRGTPAQLAAKQAELFPDVRFPVGAVGTHYQGTIFLATSAEETILHELVHATTYDLLRRFYELNGKGLTAAQKDAIRSLGAQTIQFTTLDGDLHPSVAQAQRVVHSHLVQGQSAAAANEFMAWALTNLDVQAALAQQSPAYGLGALKALGQRILAIVRKALGLPRNAGVETALEQLLGQTYRLTRRPRLDPLSASDFPNGQVLAQILAGQQAPSPHVDRLVDLAEQFEWMRSHLVRDGRDMAQVSQQAAAALQHAETIRDQFLDAGFVFTPAEEHLFVQIQATLASTAQLDASVLDGMQALYLETMPKLREEDFLEDPAVRTQDELDKAQKRFEALQAVTTYATDALGRSNLLANFIALAAVHEPLRAKLSTFAPGKTALKFGSLDEAIRSTVTAGFNKVSEAAVGTATAHNQREVLDRLLARLAKNQAATLKRMDAPGGWMAKAEGATRNALTAGAEWAARRQVEREAAGKNQSQKDVWINHLLFGISALGDEQKSTGVGESLLSMVNQGGPVWLRNLVTEMVGRVESNAPLSRLLTQTNYAVARTRQQLRDRVPAQVKALFQQPMSKATWATLHKAMQLDLASLLGPYKAPQLHDLLTDDAVRAAEIRSLTGQLGRHQARYVEAADALAHYLVHREPIAETFLYSNADAMARLLGQPGVVVDAAEAEQVAPILDRLTTLLALDKADPGLRQTVAQVLQQDRRGMHSLLHLMQALSANELTKPGAAEQKFNRWKGYLPQSLDPRSQVVLANSARGAELLQQGYRVVKSYTADAADPDTDLAYYAIDRVGGANTYNQGVLQMVEGTIGGVTAASGSSLDPGLQTYIVDKLAVADITQELAAGRPGAISRLRPIFRADGSVRAYERVLDASVLASHLKPTEDLPQALGQWLGRQSEEALASHANQQLAKVLAEAWDAGKKALKQGEFVNIELSQDPVIADAWATMPKVVRAQLKAAFPQGKVMVRKDMLENAIGYRSASVADVFTGLSRMKPEIREGIRNAALGLLGKDAYRKLLLLERTWQAAVGLAKDVIVVRSGVVALSNALSNQYQLYQATGVNPLKQMKLQALKARELETHLRHERRRAQITLELAAEPSKGRQQALRLEDQSLADASSRLSIWPLIQAGELPSIAEGLSEQDEYSILGDFTGWLEKKTEHLPKGLVTAAKVALITKDTAIYQGLNRAVQFGDFVAKAALYEHLIGQGKTQLEALDQVSDEFVNYNHRAGRGRDYGENMGITWFWAYKLRIQKIILRSIRRNPLGFLLGGGAALSQGADSLIDASLFQTPWQWSIGPGQLFRAPTMRLWDQLFN